MNTTNLLLENSKQLTILYVEDDRELAATTQELFQLFFLQVDLAYDGIEGLALYRDFYEDRGYYYDIVITDITMPDMDGLEMSKRILKTNAEQSIIIITAYNEMKYLNQAINLGIDGFITKPIENEKLYKVLNKTAQIITDRKFVLSHVDIIEDLNILLEKQNKELITKNAELEKSFRMLDTMVHKEQMRHSVADKSETSISKDNESTKLLQEQIQSLVHDDLDELKEIHSEIDLNIIATINNTSLLYSTSILEDLANDFSRYGSILSFYNFFDELSKGVSSFSSALKESDIPQDETLIKNVFMLLENFMYVLKKWQDDLASQDTSKVNALDASIISDMQTIINMWTQKEQETSEEDLDDIFDF